MTIDELLTKSLSTTVRQQLLRLKTGVIAKTNIPGKTPNVESSIKPKSLAKEKGPGYYGPVIIRVLERRHRLPDRDGSSFKYLLDALVSAKILQDDNREIVKDIERTEVKIPRNQDEETIVEIWKEKQ